MGLDTTHDAFSGAYSAFNRFRQIVAKAAGGSYPNHDKPLILKNGKIIEEPDQENFYVPYSWEEFQKKQPGLSAFLLSNDCEGSFSPEICGQMANELEALIPEIEKLDDGGGGHIERNGGYTETVKKYIAGCRLAESQNEFMEYY